MQIWIRNKVEEKKGRKDKRRRNLWEEWATKEEGGIERPREEAGGRRGEREADKQSFARSAAPLGGGY